MDREVREAIHVATWRRSTTQGCITLRLRSARPPFLPFCIVRSDTQRARARQLPMVHTHMLRVEANEYDEEGDGRETGGVAVEQLGGASGCAVVQSKCEQDA